jgi:two-component system, NarL family, nitrate/nitrite response regulator NarL
MVGSESSPSEIIRVAVHEYSRMATQLLCAALSQQPRFEVIDIGGKSVAETAAINPHVALVGASGPGDPVIGRIEQLCRIRPEMKAVLLVDQPARELVLEAFRAGARGVFLKSGSVDYLIKCISRVHDGQIWADQNATEFLLEAIREPIPIPVVDAKGHVLLSEREQSIVRGVAEGLTNRGIANQLELSEHTVKNYLFRIFDKLGVSSRVELILYAMAHLQQAQAVHLGAEKDGEKPMISPTCPEEMAREKNSLRTLRVPEGRFSVFKW